MRNHIYTRFIYIFTLCFLLPLISAKGQAIENDNIKSHYPYTRQHPLIVEGLWDLWPLSFLNENGEPTGIDVEMTKYLLDKLNIPYVIKLKYREDVIEDLKKGKAQLSWGSYTGDHKRDFKFCSQCITFLVNAVAYRKKEVHISYFDELSKAKIIVHNGSGAHDQMINAGWAGNISKYEDMRKAMNDLANRKADYVVWNSQSLTYLKNTYHFDSIEIASIDGMPPSPYKFMGTDTVLLHKLDSVFSLEYAKGNLTPIYDEWFYTDKYRNLPKWIFAILLFAVVVFLVLILYNFIYRRKINEENNRIKILDGRLALALKSGSIMLWIFDVKKNTLFRLDNKEDMKEGILLDDFKNDISKNQYERMKANFKLLIEGKKNKIHDVFQTNHFSDEKNTVRVYNVVASIFEKDKYGNTVSIIGTNKDITEHYERKAKEKDMLLKYKTVFNSAMVAISYITNDGIYKDINDRWCKYFHIKDKAAFLKTRPNVNDIWGKDYEFFENGISSWIATDIDLKSNESNDTRDAIPERHVMIERRLAPVFDNNGKDVAGYCSSFVDQTEKIKSFQDFKDYFTKTKNATEEIRMYADSINQILKGCGIRLFWLNVKTFSFRISDDAEKEGKEYGKNVWMKMLSDDSKQKAIQLIQKIKEGLDEGFSISIQTKTELSRDIHYEFIGMPELDEEENINHFFGLAIDFTELAETQNLLEKKKKEAQKADLLKSAFLKNMSYEIRTPLQAVVGFSELLSEVQNESDESFFVSEIKKNTNILLKIVNDILFLSKIDAGMVEMKKELCDIALLCKSRCDIAKEKLQDKDIEFISLKGSNEVCTVETDSYLITRILDNMLNNAVKFTEKGYIKVNYSYEEGSLVLFVEDTGCGIDKDMRNKVFDRFVKTDNSEWGPGLGLSFCKAITELMGGEIHLESEKGCGTTVWVNIPCKRIAIENKVIV